MLCLSDADYCLTQVKKWQPFAKCDECIGFRTKLLTTLNDAELEETKEAQFKHREQVSLGRQRFALREQMSVNYKNDFLHVSIDGMDNKKTNVPQQRSLTCSKSSAGVGEPLKTRLMGEWSLLIMKVCCIVNAANCVGKATMNKRYA